MDISGTLIIVAGVTCFVLALQWGGLTKSWSDGSVIACLIIFGLCIVIFIVNEWYWGHRAMMLDRLLKQRVISLGMAYNFLIGGGNFLLLYYIPLYFQVISGVSPSESGIRNLPLIIAVVISTIISGGLITVYGHIIPIMISSAITATIGCGLIYTLDIESSSAKWIGYQALVGIGIGFGLQTPIILAQAVVEPHDLSSATAMVLFAQTIAGAFFVSAGQSAFQNVLLQRLPLYTGIDPQTIISVGTTEIRTSFPPEAIPGILHAYMDGLKVAYAIAIASAGLAVFVAAGNKWMNLKGKATTGGAA